MGGDSNDGRRRVVFAQGLAALGCFVAVHGAHAATIAKSPHASTQPARVVVVAQPVRR